MRCDPSSGKDERLAGVISQSGSGVEVTREGEDQVKCVVCGAESSRDRCAVCGTPTRQSADAPSAWTAPPAPPPPPSQERWTPAPPKADTGALPPPMPAYQQSNSVQPPPPSPPTARERPAREWGAPPALASTGETRLPPVKAPMPRSPHPRHGPSGRVLLAGGVAGVLVVAAVVFALLTRSGLSNTQASAGSPIATTTMGPAPSSPPNPVTVTAAPPPPVPAPLSATPTFASDPEEAALARLRERASQDATRINKSGQWFAQLASKYVGVVDPRQVTADGSHTFTAVDIWAEFEATASRLGFEEVFLLDSRTYGKRYSHQGEALWVVGVHDPSFGDQASVREWCAGLYPNLSGDELTNVCMPNRLNP